MSRYYLQYVGRKAPDLPEDYQVWDIKTNTPVSERLPYADAKARMKVMEAPGNEDFVSTGIWGGWRA